MLPFYNLTISMGKANVFVLSMYEAGYGNLRDRYRSCHQEVYPRVLQTVVKPWMVSVASLGGGGGLLSSRTAHQFT